MIGLGELDAGAVAAGAAVDGLGAALELASGELCVDLGIGRRVARRRGGLERPVERHAGERIEQRLAVDERRGLTPPLGSVDAALREHRQAAVHARAVDAALAVEHVDDGRRRLAATDRDEQPVQLGQPPRDDDVAVREVTIRERLAREAVGGGALLGRLRPHHLALGWRGLLGLGKQQLELVEADGDVDVTAGRRLERLVLA